MKKLTGAFALILAVFSLFYFSETALASKALIGSAPSAQVVDVSAGDMANFQLTNLDGAPSVQVEARVFGSGSAFTTVTGLTGITALGTVQKSASQLQNQYGTNVIEWRFSDEFTPNHYSSLSKIDIVQ